MGVESEKDKPGSAILVFGVFRSPEQFVDTALGTKHPILLGTCLPKPSHEAILRNAELSAKEISQHRVDTLKEWAH